MNAGSDKMKAPDMAADLKKQFEQLRILFGRLEAEVAKQIVGQGAVVRDVLIAVLAGEHVLLEGVPGLGKTLLVRTLGQVAHLRFTRIQFTPDLMPADITGTQVVVERSDGSGREFAFHRGPVFSNIVLADEINRATPKTQAALLEAMQERSVTIAGTTHDLNRPFLVLATQNPLEMEGTYPLPEAQLDRFFFKVMVPYPTDVDLGHILAMTTDETAPVIERICEGDVLLEYGRLVRQIPMADAVLQQVVKLVRATHPDDPHATESVRQYVRYGASPRGGQALILGAKIVAVLDGRYHVAWEDVAALARQALRHRIVLNFEGQANQVSPDDVLDDLVGALGP